MSVTKRERICDELDDAKSNLHARLEDAVTAGVNIDKLIEAMSVYIDARIELALLND